VATAICYTLSPFLALCEARTRPQRRLSGARLTTYAQGESFAFDPRRTWVPRSLTDFYGVEQTLLCLCVCHLESGQAGTLDRRLHQPRRLGLFDEFADVGEPRGLTLRNHHADEVGSVVFV